MIKLLIVINKIFIRIKKIVYHPAILYIAMRYTFRPITQRFSSFIFWFSTITVVIDIIALTIVLSIMNGFENILEKKILQFVPQVLITNTERKVNLKDIPISILKFLKDCMYITSLIIDNVIVCTVNNASMGVMLGINPNDFEPLASYLLDTSIDQLVAGKYRVILGKQLAEQLGVKKGDNIRLILPNVSFLTVIGHIFSQRLFEVSGIYDAYSEVNNYQLLVHQKDASLLMQYPEEYVTGWRLFFKHPLISCNFKLHDLPYGLLWEDWSMRRGDIFQAMCFEKYMMYLLLSLIVIVSIFNIIISLGILVIEKKMDIAVLKTQGLGSFHVILIFSIYGFNAVFLGSITGVLFGLFLTDNLSWIVSNFSSLLLYDVYIPVLVKPFQIFTVIMYFMILSFIIILCSSWRIISIYPTKILRHDK